jgi:hypothetical protein
LNAEGAKDSQRTQKKEKEYKIKKEKEKEKEKEKFYFLKFKRLEVFIEFYFVFNLVFLLFASSANPSRPLRSKNPHIKTFIKLTSPYPPAP